MRDEHKRSLDTGSRDQWRKNLSFFSSVGLLMPQVFTVLQPTHSNTIYAPNENLHTSARSTFSLTIFLVSFSFPHLKRPYGEPLHDIFGHIRHPVRVFSIAISDVFIENIERMFRIRFHVVLPFWAFWAIRLLAYVSFMDIVHVENRILLQKPHAFGATHRCYIQERI